jgi:hypothetical protein
MFKPVGMEAMKTILPLSMVEQGPCFYRHNNLYNFELNKQVHSPTALHNLQRQAINTCYTERKKNKRDAGKVLLLKVLNVSHSSKGAENLLRFFQLKNEMRSKKSLLRSPPLAIDFKFFHCPFANPYTM